MSETPTYVLVPGAWCGAWAWEDLLPHLDGPAVTIELPSTGDDAAALGDLHADAAAVRAAIDDVDGPVVLVGHSYGGMVVNEVADHPRIVHSVYLTAFWPPAPGASMFSILGAAPEWAADNGDGTISVTSDPVWARRIMCADLDADRSAELSARLRPHSLSSFASETTGRTHPHPTTYVVCDDDQAIPAPAQVGMSGAADHVVHLSSGHFPQVTVAAKVARVLQDVAVPSTNG
ncbi:alpha/beta hydrolase [Patulibacter minatonensis]|uniref:alpha/beta hydrolase n=1 Tax=Patulibacter minatonensis TaxID=298163 RepID=UPI00047A01B5|nr:alpha/beta hydrolase [Patulibacter minatonensis]